MTDQPEENQEECSRDHIRAGYEYLFSLPAPLLKAVIAAEIKNSFQYWTGQIERREYLRWKNLSWFTKEARIARQIGWTDRG